MPQSTCDTGSVGKAILGLSDPPKYTTEEVDEYYQKIFKKCISEFGLSEKKSRILAEESCVPIRHRIADEG